MLSPLSCFATALTSEGADLGLSQLRSLTQRTKLLEVGNVLWNLTASHEIQLREMQNPASGIEYSEGTG